MCKNYNVSKLDLSKNILIGFSYYDGDIDSILYYQYDIKIKIFRERIIR